MENEAIQIKLKPPRFRSMKNVRHFLSKFEKFALFKRISRDVYRDFLGLLLDGNALDYFDLLLR